MSSIKGLPQIFYNVVGIFNAHRQPDKVGCHSCFDELLVGKLAVGVACRVQDARTSIGNMGDNANEFQAIHELYGIFA